MSVLYRVNFIPFLALSLKMKMGGKGRKSDFLLLGEWVPLVIEVGVEEYFKVIVVMMVLAVMGKINREQMNALFSWLQIAVQEIVLISGRLSPRRTPLFLFPTSVHRNLVV